RTLDGEVTHPLQDALGLAQRTLGDLDDGDAVLRVALGDVVAVDLALETLRDGEARGVVRGPVDAQTAGELLQGAGLVRLGRREVAVRTERGDVGVDAEAH